MPFASEPQRKYLYAKHPGIAKRWSREQKGRRTPPIYQNPNQPTGQRDPSSMKRGYPTPPSPYQQKLDQLRKQAPSSNSGPAGEQRNLLQKQVVTPSKTLKPVRNGPTSPPNPADRTAAMERKMQQMNNQKQLGNTQNKLNSALQQKRLGNQVDRKLK